MSELKVYGMNDPKVGDEYEMYKVSEVDAVLAEKDAKIHELENMPHTDNSAVIDALETENEALKKELAEKDAEIKALKQKRMSYGDANARLAKENTDLKLIAESRGTEVAQLLMKIAELEKLVETANLIKNEQLAAARHHKHKRCLAMAMWCCDACDKWMMRKAKAIGLGKDGVKEYHQARRKLFHYMRWQTRWLKIAEKFKEAK